MDVRFDDDQLAAAFVEAAADEVEELVFIDLAGTGSVIPDDVIFFAEEERYGNGMDLRAEQDARIRFGADSLLAAAEEVDGTAEEFLRRVEESACRQDIRIGLDALCRTQ